MKRDKEIAPTVIPVKTGIQKKKCWIPDLVGNDNIRGNDININIFTTQNNACQQRR